MSTRLVLLVLCLGAIGCGEHATAPAPAEVGIPPGVSGRIAYLAGSYLAVLDLATGAKTIIRRDLLPLAYPDSYARIHWTARGDSIVTVVQPLKCGVLPGDMSFRYCFPDSIRTRTFAANGPDSIGGATPCDVVIGESQDGRFACLASDGAGIYIGQSPVYLDSLMSGCGTLGDQVSLAHDWSFVVVSSQVDSAWGCGLYRAALPAGPRQLIAWSDTIEFRRPVVSPLGDRIAFEGSGPTGGTWIGVVNADGTNLHRVASGWDGAPSWSPDGKWVVFARHEEAIWLATPEGGVERKILSFGTEPSWSPTP